ncbi:MAG: YncE family protein [Solirubrobacterales bacterium]
MTSATERCPWGDFPSTRLSFRHLNLAPRAVATLGALAALALPASAFAAPAPPHARQKAATRGTLTQLPRSRGCLVDRSTPSGGCGIARALKGPGPFMGSRAIALSPDGKNVYVASSGSDAIAIFRRDARTGTLTQPKGAAGCIAAKGSSDCATAVGLDGPNSVAVSPDGRNVYATSRASNTVSVFRRNPSTGALSQLPAGAGCISRLPVPVCASGRALVGPDVVIVSPGGKNVYVGSFFGNAVAVFNRDRSTGALTQPAGSTGCIAEATSGCAPGLALGAPEGMAISGDGASVYVATALSNAVVVLSREPSTGTPLQATDGSGCIVNSQLAGCTTGAELSGANAVTVSPGDDDVYVTSLFSNSVTSFTRSTPSGGLTQKSGTSGCVVWLRAVGCSFGRALSAPEALAVSPGKRVCRRIRHGRHRRPRSRQEIRLGGAEVGPRRLPRPSLGPRLHARPRAARRQLDCAQPRRPSSVLDVVRQQRRRHLPEEQMSQTDKPEGGLTRKELIGSSP